MLGKYLAVFLALELAASGLESAAAAPLRPQVQGHRFRAQKGPKILLERISQAPLSLIGTPLNFKYQPPLTLKAMGSTDKISKLPGPQIKTSQALATLAANLQNSKEGEPQKAGQTLRSAFDGQKPADHQSSPVEAEEAQTNETETPSQSLQQQASDPKNQPPHNLWQVLENSLVRVLGAQDLPSRAEAWRKETAEILRDDPVMPIETALLKAFAKVQAPLGPAQSKILARLLSGKAGMVPGIPKTRIDRVVRIGDTLYAATFRGLYAQGRKGWSRMLTQVHDIAAYQGRLYLGAQKGLYVKEGRSWKKIAEGTVTRLLKAEDGLYVATMTGLFKLGQEKWLLEGMPILDLAEWNGGIYAGTRRDDISKEGLYQVKPRPRRVLDHEVYSLSRIGERLYASTANGLYAFEGGKKIGLELRGLQVLHAVRIGETLHAATYDGVYRRRGEKDWELLPWHTREREDEVSGVYHIHEDFDGALYLSTFDGLAVFWPSERLTQPALEDLKGLVQETRPALDALRQEKEGNVLEAEDGRSLLSGLVRR